MKTKIGQLAFERNRLDDELRDLRRQHVLIHSREAVVRSKIASYDREIEDLKQAMTEIPRGDE
jgi:hypothetical protein